LSTSSFHVSRDLTCRTCGYQLRGISALGRCPECGAEVMTSIVTAADPDLRRLAALRGPRRTAAALMAVIVAVTLACLVQFVGPSIELVHDLANDPGPRAARWLALGWWSAAALLVIAAIAALAVAPPSERLLRAEWGRRRIALQAGLFLWAIVVVALPPILGWRTFVQYPSSFVLIVSTAAQLLAAMAPLGGLRSLYSILGRRSRRWREARQGRQGVDALVAAGGGVLVFATAVPIMAAYRFELLHTLALLLTVASAAVLGIGLIYLVANALWIARSLVRPPALIESYVEGSESGPSEWSRTDARDGAPGRFDPRNAEPGRDGPA